MLVTVVSSHAKTAEPQNNGIKLLGVYSHCNRLAQDFLFYICLFFYLFVFFRFYHLMVSKVDQISRQRLTMSA